MEKTQTYNNQSWCVVETQPEVPQWEQKAKTGLTESEAKEYAKNRNSGPSGRAGYVYKAESETNQS